MTSIQVAYWQLQEQKRANAANEAIKASEAESAKVQAKAAARNAESREREVAFKEKESDQERYMKQVDYLFDIPRKVLGTGKSIGAFSSLMDGFVTLFA